MSQTALTTVSPSRVSRRRSVVCVAGCCGPKLSVQRYSWPPSGAAASTISRGIAHRLAFGPRDDGEVVPLPAAAERVVLAHGERRELLGHEDAAQVRVAGEDDPVHVEDLALHPVGTLPQRERGRDRQVR